MTVIFALCHSYVWALPLKLNLGWAPTSAQVVQGALKGSPVLMKKLLTPSSLGNLIPVSEECKTTEKHCGVKFPNANSMDRTVIEIKASIPLKNHAGNDFVVFDNSPEGKPSAYGVAIFRKATGKLSAYRYNTAILYGSQIGAAAFATAFDLTDFDVEADESVDTIRIVNLSNNNSPSYGDRVDSPEGEGNILFEGSSAIGYPLVPGILSNATFFPDTQLEATIVAVSALF